MYFTNLCLTLSLSAAELAECERVVGGKLKSGYKVYSKYLITPESSMSNEIAVANRKYTIPALLRMLETWNL